jgi:hypothetical protein
MSPATPTLNKKEVSALPFARIDAQDPHFAEPVREFLSSRGCDVSVNHTVTRPVTYHIISGDVEFVKEIMSRHPTPAPKRLILLWQHERTPQFKPGVGEKIVLVDARPLTGDDVEKIFSFFFTGRRDSLDIRKFQRFDAPPEARVRTHDVHRAVVPSDETRITQTIREVFAGDARRDKAPVKKKSKRVWGRVVAFVFALILFSWITYGILLATGSVALIWGGRLIISGNSSLGGRMVAASSSLAAAAKRMLPVIGVQFAIVGRGDLRAQQELVVGLLLESSQAASGADRILTVGQRVAASLFLTDAPTSATGGVAADIAALRRDIGSVQDHLALSQAQLDRLVGSSTFPFGYLAATRVGREARSTLHSLRESISYLDHLLTLYPHMAGFSQEAEYLLLFQNSMELRPTGGFIGSVGTVVFEDGRMGDLAVRDVYELDGQLKGHVDPPAPLQELMGTEHWYLRDSNWNPDFHASATQAAWFYEKEAGRTPQGVIGISVPFVIDLLRATGPIELPDVNDRITADNFFGKSLLYTQTDFFPGSTQKKDFLGSLASALIRRITQEERGVAPGALLRAITKGLKEKNILFYFRDPELQALVSQYGWTGDAAPIPVDCPTGDTLCPTDGLAVVEANVGVNKANYFVTREALHQVALGEDGAADHLLTLRYHNASPGGEQAQGAGIYRAYVRLLLPAGIAVSAVSVNGVAIRARDTRSEAVALPFAQLEEGHEGKTVLGLAFEVPPLGDTQVSVGYRNPNAVALDQKGGGYRLLVRKQPGFTSTVWQTNILHPLFWIPTLEGGEATLSYIANQARVEYNTTLDQDELIRIRFDK